MKYVRWIVGVLLGLYALLSAVTVVGFATAYKLGALKIEGPELTRLQPWLASAGWLELGLAAVSVALLLVVVWRLFTGGKAFLLYAASFLIKLVSWWIMSGGAGYKAAFTADERASDYVILAILAVFGIVIWWSERRRA